MYKNLWVARQLWNEIFIGAVTKILYHLVLVVWRNFFAKQIGKEHISTISYILMVM